MKQALDQFLHEVEMPDGGIAEEAFLRGWNAALEASHHEELVGVLTRCQRFFVSNWSAEEAVACDQAVNTALAKIGGDA